MTTPRPLKIGLLLVCLVGLLILAFWMGEFVYKGRNQGKDLVSRSNFAKLELMLHIYYQEHGAFPPTKYQPVAGGPMHSWRVLLVPHSNRNFRERYSQYDFSQEWNSTNNLKALGRMPYFRDFRMDDDENSDITNYLAIGDDDEWPVKKPLRSRLVTKGKDRFLIVEDPDSQIHWMEPKY